MACGDIQFVGIIENTEGLLCLLQSYGLKDIKIEERNGRTWATFAPIGSQYSTFDRLLLKDQYDWDSGHLVPKLPDKCLNCNGTGFWLKGDPYVKHPKLEWQCMKCEPRPFKINNG
jgi:hypothetical protein